MDGVDQSIRTNSGLSKQAEEYITGIVVGALLIFSLALVWLAVIIGFKIAGVAKVGFLAGRFQHPHLDERRSQSQEDTGREVGALPVICEEPEAGDDTENDSTTSDSHVQVMNEEETETDRKFQRRVFRTRTIFILCGIGAIVCGMLFYTMVGRSSCDCHLLQALHLTVGVFREYGFLKIASNTLTAASIKHRPR